MKKIILIVTIISIIFTGCANEQPSTSKSVVNQKKSIKKNSIDSFKSNSIKNKDFEIINQDGILKIRDKNKEYILTARGLDYNPHLSNDKKVLVVDTLLMSNLQTIKIFIKKDNKFKKSNKHVSKRLWERYLKNKSYTIKDVQYPKLQFRDWVDNDTFEVELSGEVNGKVIKDILRYDVR